MIKANCHPILFTQLLNSVFQKLKHIQKNHILTIVIGQDPILYGTFVKNKIPTHDHVW